MTSQKCGPPELVMPRSTQSSSSSRLRNLDIANTVVSTLGAALIQTGGREAELMIQGAGIGQVKRGVALQRTERSARCARRS